MEIFQHFLQHFEPPWTRLLGFQDLRNRGLWTSHLCGLRRGDGEMGMKVPAKANVIKHWTFVSLSWFAEHQHETSRSLAAIQLFPPCVF